MSEATSAMQTDATAIPETANLVVNKADLTCYFGSNGQLDVKDVVVYIRERFPNPHQKVIIETDLTIASEALIDSLIYIKGVNDDQVDQLRGVGEICYLPFRVLSENSGEELYGLRDRVAEFVDVYNILNFEILLYGEDSAALIEIWEELQGGSDVHYTTYFPVDIGSQLRLFDNGLDISVYAKQFELAQRKNILTTKYIGDTMTELRAIVRSGKVAIQDLEQTRSYYSKWLTFCLTQEFSLSPVYLRAYLAEYVDFEIAYPFDRLSFYERLAFIASLPAHVGYIGKASEFWCRYQIIQKIYPHPSMVFDVSTGEVITDGLERFELSKVKAIDWRVRFPGSKSYLVEPSTGLSTGVSDADVDTQLANIFLQMTERCARENVFLTIRNCLQIMVGGKVYVAYFDEPFGLVGTLESPLFGRHIYTIQEEEFKRLIDVRMILALESQSKASSIQQGRENFTRVMTLAAKTMKTAIPTYLQMLCEISSDVENELSYYDRRLRRDKCIVPIVTHLDSDIRRRHTVFDYLDFKSVKHDRVASGFISSFGSLNTFDGYNKQLPVCIDTFRGCKLL